MIKVAIKEISEEFGERINSRSNLTRVGKVYQNFGKTPEQFVSRLYEARSITKQQEKVRKRMPYFFSVLEDTIGV